MTPGCNKVTIVQSYSYACSLDWTSSCTPKRHRSLLFRVHCPIKNIFDVCLGIVSMHKRQTSMSLLGEIKENAVRTRLGRVACETETKGHGVTFVETVPVGCVGTTWIPWTASTPFITPSSTINFPPPPPSSPGWNNSSIVPRRSASLAFKIFAAENTFCQTTKPFSVKD